MRSNWANVAEMRSGGKSVPAVFFEPPLDYDGLPSTTKTHHAAHLCSASGSVGRNLPSTRRNCQSEISFTGDTGSKVVLITALIAVIFCPVWCAAWRAKTAGAPAHPPT